MLSKIPPALKAAHRAEEYMKGMVSPGTLFEEIGFNYIGLVDGHDTNRLIEVLSNIRDLRGPQLLHIVTQKGKGYTASENDPFGMHALTKIEVKPRTPQQYKTDTPSYSKVFGDWLCDMAQRDDRLVAITPAMSGGSGMDRFADRFPQRFFDVAIAEQHAITFAAGMACDGVKPVVAIYSTFLQRGYDQLIHDVALQNLDVLFAIDRAGLVGEDGPTHAGSFDLSFLRCIPNMLVMAPSDENECRQMLYTGHLHIGPAAVRYPRGKGPGATISQEMQALPIGRGIVRRKGHSIAILGFGSMVQMALDAADVLDASVADMRFIKPLDHELIHELASKHDLLVTVEENTISGGAGSAVNEWLLNNDFRISVLNLGLPDTFVAHGRVPDMLASVGLDKDGILVSIRAKLARTKLNTRAGGFPAGI
jgi:1-deoxy-D-xylulose-5-phosphate synthase